MKKVIEFIPLMANGGAETMMKDYCLGINKDEVDITVVVMGERMNSANEALLEGSGQRIIYLGEKHYAADAKLNPVQKMIRFVSRYTQFKKTVKEIKPDVIHIHLHVGLYFRMLPAKLLRETKLIYTVHNVFDRYFSKTPGDIYKYIEYKELKRLINKYSLKLVTLHDEMKSIMENEFDTKDVITIENGIELKRFSFTEEGRSKIREELGIPQDAYVIGNVGRFHEQKNHELIVEVFNKVAKQRDDAYLLLVGKGANTRQQTVDKLTELGLLERTSIIQDRKDIPEIMSAMDVFLFPSRWEGFGNVMIEAQAVGLHCVISDKVPEETIVTDNVTVVGLDEPVEVWVESLKDDATRHKRINDIKRYDIADSIARLQAIYTE